MGDRVYYVQAKNDFTRVRKKEIMTRLLNLFKPRADELLSLRDVRSLLKPESETYRGMQTVPISQIVGSEGRYRDFNKAFLPRHDKLMRRWMKVDVAHYLNMILPPIKLFEIGGVYFVRDGNHRVSVARAQGIEFIDAEVISLETDIAIQPGMSHEDLERAIIQFERKRFYQLTRLETLRPDSAIEFTAVGRYEEILNHIQEHKWFINLDKPQEIPFSDAVLSWYDNVYLPVVKTIREERLLSRFPHRTEGDLYVFIGNHLGELSKKYGPIFTLEEAAEDFSFKNRKPLGKRLQKCVGKLRRILSQFIGGRTS